MKKVSSFFISEKAVSQRSEKRQLISENFCEAKILVLKTAAVFLTLFLNLLIKLGIAEISLETSPCGSLREQISRMASFARASGHVNTRVFVKQKLEVKIRRIICAVDFKPPIIFSNKKVSSFFVDVNAVLNAMRSADFATFRNSLDILHPPPPLLSSIILIFFSGRKAMGVAVASFF